ncbi:alcohol dehydrogenase [Pleurostoma richardsiae]|uniref:Alcohol dehydrogenase n=1 Tax=Pleurostoma richardsiae TaxID=41990 RepID=A0AA38RGH9_9PEZI|nr:alcohol dehydrogenase [Pleurostoma richardsiae]
MLLTRFCAFVAFVRLALSAPPHYQRREVSPSDLLDTYDYIVVGSGPGGGPLAARLAIAGKTVLLIDAGEDQGDAIPYQVPALSLQSTEYEPMRWNYYVNHYSNLTAQKQDSKMTYTTPSGGLYIGKSPPAGSKPKGILYPRAGALGGCSAHNALITVYPHASDWNGIASLTGDSSWAASNMRGYFQRLENCSYLPNSVAGHGFSGWLTTSLTSLTLVVEDSKLLRIVLNAAQAMGQGGLLTNLITSVTGLAGVLLTDLNAGTATRDSTQGVYQMPIATDNGFRANPRNFILDTANAVNPDGSRKYHLDLLLNTLVTKVRFDTSGARPKAVGVNFIHGESLYRADPRAGGAGSGTAGSATASGEVILAAGSFNTPQLLKLSGIGPRAELQALGIRVLADRPGVGTNLQDRYETTVIGKADTDFVVTHDCTFYRTPDDPCLVRWQNGLTPDLKGVYASNGLAIAIVKKSSSAAASDDPDLFILGAPVSFKGYYEGYAAEGTADAQHWSWLTLKAHSRNRAGTVRLRSTDPRDMPLVDFNSFADPATGLLDVKAVAEGMAFTRGMLSSVGGFTEVWPGPGVTAGTPMETWIRDEAWGHHACCTAPIGATSDPAAVLDSQFRVIGVDNLRVVDASAFPKIPGFFLAVPVYMLSEKAADVILGL